MRINVEKIDCQNGKKQIFTRGNSYSSGDGVNWGRTAWGNGNAHRKGIELDAALIHEGTHWQQQRTDGFAIFLWKNGQELHTINNEIWNN